MTAWSPYLLISLGDVSLSCINQTIKSDFGKCGPIFKILSPTDSQENYLVHVSTAPAICCYITLWNSLVKNVTDFDSFHNKLLTCSCRQLLEHLIKHLTVVRQSQVCWRWRAKFWSLSDDASNQQLNGVASRLFFATHHSDFFSTLLHYLCTVFVLGHALYICTHIIFK